MEENNNGIVSNLDGNSNGNKKKGNGILFVVILFILVTVASVGYLIILNKDKDFNKVETEEFFVVDKDYLAYKIVGNSIGDFDLRFMKTTNDKKNVVYSPLSIKYALAMLSEGTGGESKKQIDDILGNYNAKNYSNSANRTLANALFVRDTYKDNIKVNYIDNLKNKYNANIVYDSFNSTDNINNWVKKNTFNLVDGIVDDVSDLDFVIANALAIDMEWVNKIKPETIGYTVTFPHREFGAYVSDLVNGGFMSIDFKDTDYKSKAVDFAAVSNKYNIIHELGEQNIINTVSAEYKKWLIEDPCDMASESPSVEDYMVQYMAELNEGYGHVSSSTDFKFYVDDNIKVFSKDLKEYDGSTLQYVGIMPTNVSLDRYINDVKSSDIDVLINKLKPIELNSFKDGVITHVEGLIPLFDFEYELNLVENLKLLGIQNVFDSGKADLSNLTSGNAYISKAVHKANIEFSNDGIKAGAATALGGAGAAGCRFDYIYDVPVEKIDITFDKPFLFFVMDKETKEVWFAGTVYEPKEENVNEDYLNWDW